MYELIDLLFAYQGQRQNTLDHLSISFPERGFMFIFGDSGSGKSTLLNLIAGRYKATAGQMMFEQRVFSPFDSEEDRNEVAYMAQESELMQGLTVCDQILLLHPETTRKEVLEFLKKVHLFDCADRKISKLSNGEKQRVSVALHMIERKKILLCDEITTDLDYRNKEAVLDLLKEASKTGLVLCVSHETEFYEEYADAIYRLEDGRMTVLKETESVSSETEPVALAPSLKKTDPTGILLRNHLFHHTKTFLTTFLCLLTMFLGCLNYFRVDGNLRNAIVSKNDYALCNQVLITEDEGENLSRFVSRDSSIFYMNAFKMQYNFIFEQLPILYEQCSYAFATLSFFKEDLIFGEWTEDDSAVYIGVDPETYGVQNMKKDYLSRFKDIDNDKPYYIAGFFSVKWDRFGANNKPVFAFKTRPSCLKPVFVDASGTPLSCIVSDREDSTLTLLEGMETMYIKTQFGRIGLDFGSYEIHRDNTIRIPYKILTELLENTSVPTIFFYDSREDKKADASKVKCIDPEQLIVRENSGDAGDDINFFIEIVIIVSSFIFIALLNLALSSGDRRWKKDMDVWRILRKNDSEIAALNRRVFFVIKGGAWILFWGIVLILNHFSSFSLLSGAFGISFCYLVSVGLMKEVRRQYD